MAEMAAFPEKTSYITGCSGKFLTIKRFWDAFNSHKIRVVLKSGCFD
jgi:hypothetical protein